MYTFHLRRSDGAPDSLETFELDHDGSWSIAPNNAWFSW